MDMKSDSELTKAGEQYAAAHAAHYTTKNLHEALELYTDVVARHPDAPEAGYAHSQIQNIVNSVVPKQDLLDAQLALALARTP
ncbi:hypothetical protein ACFL6C_03730 [Myxococcota bacterium]